MRRWMLSAWVGVAAAFLSSSALAQERHARQGGDEDAKPAAQADEKASPLCPVSGEPISRKSYTHYRGKRVFFCCSDCEAAFNKDPGKYAKQIKAQWEAMKPLRAQVTCPVTGEPVSTKYWVDTPACDVYFATEEAKAAWEKDAKPFETKLKDCYTFQTTCPSSGKDINPEVFLEVKSQKMYFCCGGCKASAEKEPEAALKKVEEQMAANKKAYEKENP